MKKGGVVASLDATSLLRKEFNAEARRISDLKGYRKIDGTTQEG